MALFEIGTDNSGGGPGDPKPKRVRLVDRRKKLAATGAAIRPDKDLKGGEYDPEIIERVAKMAAKHGVDPYKAVSIALQESNLGKTGESLGHTGEVLKGQEKEGTPEWYAEQLVLHMKRSEATADRVGRKTFAERAQVYNGLGTITANYAGRNGRGQGMGTKITSLYGMQLKDGQKVDLGKTNLYGKTVEDLMENVVKKSPEVTAIIDKYMPKKDTKVWGSSKLPADSTATTPILPPTNL